MRRICFFIQWQGNQFSIEANANDTLMSCIRSVTNKNAQDFVCFKFNGILDARLTISELGIVDEDTIFLRENNDETFESSSAANSPVAPVFAIKSKKEFSPCQINSDIDISCYTDLYQPPTEQYLLLQPIACDELYSEIEWGKLTSRNEYEEGGILIGKVFQYQNKVYGVVEHVISSGIIGRTTHISFSHEVWNDMLKSLDSYNETNKTDLVVIGWYHTHPVNIAPEFSDTDYTTQRTHFSKYWQFALVLNPQKKTFNAYCGATAKQCPVVFFQRAFNYDGRKEVLSSSYYASDEERQLKTDYELLMRLAHLNPECISVAVLDRQNLPYVKKYNITFNTDVLVWDRTSPRSYAVTSSIVLQIDLNNGYPSRQATIMAISDKPLHPFFDEYGVYYPSKLNNANNIQEIVIELWSELNYRVTHGENERVISEYALRVINEDKPQISYKSFTKLKTE